MLLSQFRRKYKEARALTSTENGNPPDNIKRLPEATRNERNHAVVTRHHKHDVTVSSPPAPKVAAAPDKTDSDETTEHTRSIESDSESELRSPWHANTKRRSTAVPVYHPTQTLMPSVVPPAVTVESGIPGMHWALVPAAEPDDPWERIVTASPRPEVHTDRRYDLFERAPSPRTARVSPSLQVGNAGVRSDRMSPRPSSPRTGGGLLAPVVSRPCSLRAAQQSSGRSSPRQLPWAQSLFVSEYDSRGANAPKHYDLYM